jgi:CheY-like chemotaxis protein
MKCPKCSASFSASPDDSGFYVCPTCGSKLRSRAVAAPSPRGVAAPEAAASEHPNATLPAGTPLKPIPRPGEPPPSLELVLAEIRAVRRMQEDLVGLLRARPAAAAEGAPGEEPSFPSFSAAPPALRARRRKTVLLIDDDASTRAAAAAALEQSQVPVRAIADGNAGLAAIAEEKPDVIVMELDVKGSMGGKDVINMIKATMEWVDIPIVLYTRLPIESQKEARTIHGADELVAKGPGSPEALVARVISIFRRA